MRDPELFDTFYKEARDRLLLQTFALTGDRAAARAAVRDSFVMAWHHWRKISQADDPEHVVRPHAWRHAQRRHTARLWHRDKSIDPDAKATLDALGKLPVNQRRALLLTQLASVSMPQMAREVGLPPEEAERELSTAMAQFSLYREVPAAEIRQRLEPLAEVVGDARWPRATIIRRAGAARRRTHTVVGVVAAATALLVSASVVTDPTGARPTLDRAADGAAATGDLSIESDERVSLSPEALLGGAQLVAAVEGRQWTEGRTTDNDEGDGLVAPCQQERYADPRGNAALVRSFRAAAAKGAPPATAVQSAELSRTVPAARRAFSTALGWYAACAVERTQLLSTRRVVGVGDQAMLVVLRAWEAPTTTITVGLARTGRLTTTTLTQVRGEDRPDVEGHARLLGSAVSRLCTLPEGGECASRPGLRTIAPLPVGTAPAMLTELDLPPVTGISEPWVGTDPRRALRNPAATNCDATSFQGRFQGARLTANMTRSFVVVGTRLPDEFGITETVATLPERSARAFVEGVRQRMSVCEEGDRGLGTEVSYVSDLDRGRTSMTVWRVTTEVSDKRSVEFAMAILRRGTAVAQLGFVPAEGVDMTNEAFVGLAERALERLVEVPPPRRR